MADLDLAVDTGSANSDLDGMFGDATPEGGAEATETGGETGSGYEEEVSVDDLTEGEGAEAKPEGDEPAPAPEAESVVEPDAAKPEDAKPEGDEEIPEDVEVRDHKGKKKWFFDPEKGRRIYADSKRVRAAEEILQEELTPELATTLHKAARDLEWMKLDFLSGNPKQQANFFSHFLKQANRSRELGEIGADPVITAAQTFADVLQQKHPEAYRALTAKIAPAPDAGATQKSMLRDAFADAVEKGNEQVRRSALWMARDLYGKANPGLDVTKVTQRELVNWLDSKPAAPDPISEREQQITQREQRLRDAALVSAKKSWQAWATDTVSKVGSTIGGAIDEALSPVQESYKDYPERLTNLKVRFDQEIKKAIQSDAEWQQTNEQLYTRARLAASPQVRAAVRERIAARYASKAKAVVDRLKSKIFAEDAQLLKSENASVRQRQQVAQQRRGVSGPSAPVQPTVPKSVPKGAIGRGDWEKAIDDLYSSR